MTDLPWGSIDMSTYAPAAVERARGSWTEVAINEYRAVASFSEVLRALVDVKAPLDLLGMTSDFLADECSHVELASRMAMELGGAAPRLVDFDRFTARPGGRTALQRANELILCVSCISEAFTGGTASVSYGQTSNVLPRAPFWKSKAARNPAPPPWPEDDLQALGWLGPAQFAPIAKEVVVRDILDPLESIGIAISAEERAELLA